MRGKEGVPSNPYLVPFIHGHECMVYMIPNMNWLILMVFDVVCKYISGLYGLYPPSRDFLLTMHGYEKPRIQVMGWSSK